jgi:hypothetical protein
MQALLVLRQHMEAGWHPLYSVDGAGFPVLPDDEAAHRWSVCDVLCMSATVEQQMAVEDLLQSLLPAGVTLRDWLVESERKQSEVVALVGRALLRVKALERGHGKDAA